jgi:hypothetical protein
VFRWILYRLPEFRALEDDLALVREALQVSVQEKLRLEDRLEAALADRTKLWDLMAKSIDEMKIAYQMHVNLSIQRQGGGVPYPDAPHLPVRQHAQESNEPVGRRGRQLPSEAVSNASLEFVKNLYSQS